MYCSTRSQYRKWEPRIVQHKATRNLVKVRVWFQTPITTTAHLELDGLGKLFRTSCAAKHVSHFPSTRCYNSTCTEYLRTFMVVISSLAWGWGFSGKRGSRNKGLGQQSRVHSLSRTRTQDGYRMMGITPVFIHRVKLCDTIKSCEVSSHKHFQSLTWDQLF